jgi:hypothetical protein
MDIKCLFNGLTEHEFNKKFGSEEQCLAFLASEKWSGGFVCRKCGHDNYCAGTAPYSRRCTRCKSIESATAHTIFHCCRIPLSKAFEIAWRVCCSPSITSAELSRSLETRQMTCWKFRAKVIACLKAKKGLSF